LKSGKRKLLKIVLTALAGVLALYAVVCAFGCREAMKIPRLPLTYKAGELGLAYEDVSFPTRVDGLTLKGWYLPGDGRQIIIITHGGFQNRVDDVVDTASLARSLVQKGYSVLLYDLRGRGQSDGKGITLSHIDEDIGGAVDYVKSRGFAPKDITLLGFCSGATMSSIYASRNNDIGSVILDGCFIDAGTMVIRQAEYIHLPGWGARLFIPGGMFTTLVLYGFHRIDSINVIPDIKAPVFFIHEEFDAFTTIQETQRMLAKAANPASRFWEIPGAPHSEGFKVHPQEYVEKVDNFLQNFK
jgi:pimeloyl-ACP methyl ester carboxylesterase